MTIVTTPNRFICDDCAAKLCKHLPSDGATWHEGQCYVCGEKRPVTQVRDFGGLK